MNVRWVGMFAGVALWVLVTAGAHSQTLGPSSELGLEALEMGREAIDDVPEQLNEFLGRATEGEEYDTEKECLGALQVAMNVATIASNLLPFSEAWELEDERGQVGRVRMVVNGEKIHLDAYCRGSILVGEPLPWGDNAREPQIVSQTTLDALLGGVLLLELQGAFDEGEDLAIVSEERDPVASAVEDAVQAHEAEAVTWEQRVAAQVSQCYVVRTDAPWTEIDVEVRLSANGLPSAVELIALSGDSWATETAFQDIRRAIIRCGTTSYPLPTDTIEGELSVRLRATDGLITPLE